MSPIVMKYIMTLYVWGRYVRLGSLNQGRDKDKWRGCKVNETSRDGKENQEGL